MSYKIIRVRNGIVSIASNDGTFFDVSIEELDFEPKVGDEVQCFRNGEKVIVFKDETPPCKQKQAPSPIPQNEQPSNLQANAEISTVSKTDIQGVEQNTPVENLFSDDVVEKKSRVPWVIGIMLLLLSVLLACIYLKNNNVVKGTMTDSRDGKIYKTVKIGNQTWMAENLNYRTKKGSYCYDNKESNCDKYGRLYTWKAAMKACPSGWHLPSKEEFEVLINKVGGKVIVNQALKSTSGWDDHIEGTGNGTDAYGFSALPGGGRDGYSFHYEGNHAFFWSNTTTDCEYGNSACAYHILLSYTTRAEPHYYGLHFEYVGISESVRCLKD